jgi:hypothetical protein
MDQIFLLLILIILVGALYWFHLKIDTELNLYRNKHIKNKKIFINKPKRKVKSKNDTESSESDIKSSYSNISVESITFESQSSMSDMSSSLNSSSNNSGSDIASDASSIVSLENNSTDNK